MSRTHLGTPEKFEDITGVLLAGGRSRRMFGTGTEGDKGLLELAGKPMIARVAERLAPQVGRLIVNANGDSGRFAALGLPVVPDTVPDFAGPLAGLLAGMRWAKTSATGTTHIATASTDVPFLPLDLVARLHAANESRPTSIALARSGGETHNVIGLWPVTLADDLEASLAAGMRRVQEWTGRHDVLLVEFPLVRIGGATVDPFFNANTPEELDAARTLLQTSTP